MHSVTSEDACSGEGSRGYMKREVVLRARRRSRATSGDRAKAYAFAIIPPSPQPGRGRSTTTITPAGKLAERFTDSRPMFRASSDGKLETRCNADDHRAPADGESTNSLGRAGREAFGRLHGNDLRLMGEAVTDSCGESITDIAASCKIDLRGCCSRQPFAFGVTAEESVSHSQAGLLQLTPAVGRGERLTLEGRRRRQRRADASRSRRRRGNPEQEGAQHSPSGNQLTDISTSIGSVTATRLQQKQQQQQQRRCVQRRVRDDCRNPAKSERQDADDLKCLLSASRLIFDEIEGHCEDVTPKATENGTRPESADGVDLSRKIVGPVRIQNHRAPIISTIHLSAKGAAPSSEARARCHDSNDRGNVPRRRLTGNSGLHMAGTTHCGENHQPDLSEPQHHGSKMLVRVGDGDHSSRPRMGDRPTVRRPDGLPTLGTAASDACQQGAEASSNSVVFRANGSNHRLIDATRPVDERGADGFGQQTLRPTANNIGDARIAAAVATRSMPSAPLEADTTVHSHVAEAGVAVFPAQPELAEGHVGSHGGNSPGIDSPVKAGADFGYHALSRSPYQQATYPSKSSYDGDGGDGGGARNTVGESNDPRRVEALVKDVQTRYPPDHYGSNGWGYDEASGSWIFNTDDALTPNEAHGAGDADDGWRYDQHRGTWYYEEPASNEPQTSDLPEENKNVPQQHVALEPTTGGSRGRTVSAVASVAEDRASTAVAGVKWSGGARRQGSRKKPKKTRYGAASRALLLRSREEVGGRSLAC